MRIDALTRRHDHRHNHLQPSYSFRPRQNNYNASSYPRPQHPHHQTLQSHHTSYSYNNPTQHNQFTSNFNNRQSRIPHHSQSSQHYQAQFSQPHQAQFSQPQQPYFTENIAPKQQFPSQPINLPTPLPVKHNFPTNRQVFGPPQPQNNVFHPKNSHKPTQKPEPMDTATRQTVRSNRFKPSGPRNFVAEELYNTEQTEPHPETFDYPDSYYDQSPYNANDIYSRTQTDFDLQKIEIPPQSIVAKDIRTSLPEGTELILDPLVYKDGAIEFSSCITKVKDQKATIEIRNNTVVQVRLAVHLCRKS
nr:unnamed protein product [Callosobruchus analis]